MTWKKAVRKPKKQPLPPKPLHPKHDVDLSVERPRDMKGQRIRMGGRIKRPAKFSEALGVEVPPSPAGIIVRVYRRNVGGRILVDYRCSQGSIRTAYADEVRRSISKN